MILLATIEFELNDEESRELDTLAKQLGLSKSELLRKLISLGKKDLLFEAAFTRLLNKEFSLSRATLAAQMPIVEFTRRAAERGYTYFNYSSEELERDVASLKGLLEE